MAYNPFSHWGVTGTWADHMSYSLGGTDYPLPYGTPLPAPAAGMLRTSGGSGEFAAGQVGSAGRRSILTLDDPIRDCVAVVFQHQSVMGVAKHYDERQIVGLSGASANGKDWGGDVHLHIHCLNARGGRLPFENYFSTSSTAGNGRVVINNQEEPEMTATVLSSPIGKTLVIDGVVAVGQNTPDEFAAVTGAQQVTISGEQHRAYLIGAARRDGLPLVVYVEGQPGVYVMDGGKLKPLHDVSTLQEFQSLGAPGVTITQSELAAWLG